MSISIIEQKLAQLRSHIRLMFLSYGLAKTLMWLAGLALWLYWSDRVLDLPSGARIGFLIVAVLVLLVVAVRNLVYPLSRTLSDEDLALLVEREYPLLNDRLITSLQVLKNQERYKDVASGKMIEAVVAESFDLAGKLQFGEAVRSRRLLYVVVGSIAAMTLVFGHAVFARDSMSIWVKRMFGGAAAWPTRTQLDVQFIEADQLAQFPTDEDLNINFNKDPGSDVFRVALGSDMRIIARPSGTIPDNAEIRVEIYREVKSSTGEVRHVYDSTLRREMKRETTGTEGKPDYTVFFSYNKLSAQNIREDIYVRAGDAVAGPYTIALIPPPELSSPLELTYRYEEYLRLPDRTTTERMIEGVAGTTVTLRFSTTKALNLNPKTGSRVVVDYNVGSSSNIEIKADSGKGVNHYFATLKLSAGMARYQLRLVDNEGIANAKRLGDLMQVKEDLAPSVKILFSGDPLVSNQLVAVSHDAEIPLEFELSDDYGVGGARLFWRFAQDPEFRPFLPFEKQFKDLREKPQTFIAATYKLEFAKLLGDERIPAGSLRPTVEVYIQAHDLNQTGVDERTGEPVLQSSRYSVMSYELYTVEDLRAKVSTQIRQMKTTVAEMLNVQRELQLQSREALAKPEWLNLDGEDGQRLRLEINNAFQKQNQLLRDAETVAERFGVFAQIYQFSNLERDDKARPQEFRIQSVRLLLSMAAADAELRQRLTGPLKRLEEAEDGDVVSTMREVLNIFTTKLRRALPHNVFSAGDDPRKTGMHAYGSELRKSGLLTPGCAEQAAALYGRVLSMGISPSERSDLLGELERQQRLNLLTLEMVQAQVKKWEGFDDILHGFRGLLDTQKDINNKLSDAAKER